MKYFKHLFLLWLGIMALPTFAQEGFDKEHYEDQRRDYTYGKDFKEESNLKSPDWDWNWPDWGFFDFYPIVIIVVLILIVIFVVYILQHKRDNASTRELVAATSVHHAQNELLDVSLDELIVEAEKHSDLRLLVHLNYLELLKFLHHKGEIAWEAYKTNGQFATEVKDPSLKFQFIALTLQFDRVWYGHKPLNSSEYHAWKSSIDKILSA